MTRPDRPTAPKDYLPIARAALRRRDELTAAIQADREQDVSVADQADAAARDAREAHARALDDLRAIGIDAAETQPQGDARSLAWRLAVAGAITRRIPPDRQCPHAKPDAGRPLVAFLTSRWMSCEECKPRLARRFALGVDDDHCEVCDRQATKFSEFTGTIGPVRVIGNICGVCRFWLDGLTSAP